MKTIKLSGGMSTLVDDSDYIWLNKWKWSYNGKYAYRNPTKNGKQIPVYMHRLIANTPGGMVTDHINRDRLDNCRANLRILTQKENCLNKSLQIRSKTGFIGVRNYGNKFTARVCKNEGGIRKELYLGIFETAEDAALAYDKKVIEVHGSLATTNGKLIEGWERL